MTQGTISFAPARLSASSTAAASDSVRRASLSPQPDSLRSYLPTIGIIFAVAMALRCLVALLAYWNRNIAQILWPRGIEMLGVAKSLATGNGFSSPFSIPTGPTAFVPPLYPSILAVILRIFGDHTNSSAWAILLLQCFVSALTVAPVFALALASFGHREAKAAAWLW